MQGARDRERKKKMNDYLEIFLRLLIALAFGGMVGIERSYHGRPAGFRTHTLVCLASALLMLVTVYEGRWFVAQGLERVTLDPTRLAQGIMTGIGFLGAGVIMKEGMTVRGLTTAGSIWITAAIGILVGVGFYFPACVAMVFVLSTLSVFRWLESKIPAQQYAHFMVQFPRESAMPEEDLRKLLDRRSFSIANLNYRLVDEGRRFEYRMMIRTRNPHNVRQLSETLVGIPSVINFRISPTGD
jgi:putative Mg2+ transporter-C (MgtC) family protein